MPSNIFGRITFRVAVTNSGGSCVQPFVNTEDGKGFRGIRPGHLLFICLNCHAHLFAGTTLGVVRHRCRPRHTISATLRSVKSHLQCALCFLFFAFASYLFLPLCTVLLTIVFLVSSGVRQLLSLVTEAKTVRKEAKSKKQEAKSTL